MKSNANAKARPDSGKKVDANQNTDSTRVAHIAKGKTVLPPDYSSMMAEIEKVKDPVPFEEIKQFYGIEKTGE